MTHRALFACIGCVIGLSALVGVWAQCHAGVVAPHSVTEASNGTSKPTYAPTSVTAQPAPTTPAGSATGLERVEATPQPLLDAPAVPLADLVCRAQGSLQSVVLQIAPGTALRFGPGVSTEQRVLAQFILNRQQHMEQCRPSAPALLGVVSASPH